MLWNTPPRRAAGAFFLAGLILVSTGCKPGEPTGEVNGKVTLNGQAVSSGTVSFIPATGVPVSASIQPDGTYTVRDVPLGESIITVLDTPAPGTEPGKTDKPKAGERAPAKKAEPPGGSIPPRYSDMKTSGLRFSVEKGSNSFDIPLVY